MTMAAMMEIFACVWLWHHHHVSETSQYLPRTDEVFSNSFVLENLKFYHCYLLWFFFFSSFAIIDLLTFQLFVNSSSFVSCLTSVVEGNHISLFVSLIKSSWRFVTKFLFWLRALHAFFLLFVVGTWPPYESLLQVLRFYNSSSTVNLACLVLIGWYLVQVN